MMMEQLFALADDDDDDDHDDGEDDGDDHDDLVNDENLVHPWAWILLLHPEHHHHSGV